MLRIQLNIILRLDEKLSREARSYLYMCETESPKTNTNLELLNEIELNENDKSDGARNLECKEARTSDESSTNFKI